MKCLFCEKRNIKEKYFLKEYSATFFQCQDCKLIWLDKDKWPKDQEGHYSNVYYNEEYSGRVNLDTAFSYRFPLINKYIKKQSKILEVGAASGDFLNILKEKEYEIYGVELSKRAVSIAKKKYDIDIFCGTLDNASFEDSSFDAVLLYHVLEHIPDPKIFLVGLERILKPDGVVVIEIPNSASIDSMSTKLLGSILDYPHHLYVYPKRFLNRIVLESGFRIHKTELSFSFLLADFLVKASNIFIKYPKTNTAKIGQKKSAKINIKKNSLFITILKRIFPGMKMTIILKKI